jgi:glycosyltransferase involved in cell wall biosynthesis
MAQYAGIVASVPRVVAPHDSLTRALQINALQAPRRMERAAARLQVSKMRRYEARAYAEFARVIVVTESEREFLESIAPALAVRVAGNGVDADYFAPVAAPVYPKSIGFVGRMDYAPNQAAVLYFAREVLPRVWEKLPDVSFTIVGRYPTRQIHALARDARIRVTGAVEDVRPILAAQSVIVCPMPAAGGIKNKMLEALAMAKAVVATPEAAEGLDIRDGVHALLCSDTSAMANACLRALCDPALRAQLGGAARAWAVQHPWSSTAERYVEYYREARAAVG